MPGRLFMAMLLLLGASAPSSSVAPAKSPQSDTQGGSTQQDEERSSDNYDQPFDLGQISDKAWPDAKASLQRSEAGQSLAPYLARCAFPADHPPIPFHNQRLEGAIGLASQWQSRPLSLAERRWMSACLLAFMNATGEHVRIAIVAPHPNSPDATEPDFSFREGAFYGDMFSHNPVSFACTADKPTSRAPSRAKRVCTDVGEPGRTHCGMTFTGSCQSACGSGEDGGAFRQCRGNQQTYNEVVTVFLATDAAPK